MATRGPDVEQARRAAAEKKQAGGAEAGQGSGVGGTGGSSTGVTGMGSSAIGHPSEGSGGAVSGREVEIGDAERAQGVTEQHEVSVVGNPSVHREAGLPDSAGAPSSQVGAAGSGSTTTEAGGAAGVDRSGGTVSRLSGTGSGGTTPTDEPIVDAGVRGAGARGDTPEDRSKGAGRKPKGVGEP